MKPKISTHFSDRNPSRVGLLLLILFGLTPLSYGMQPVAPADTLPPDDSSFIYRGNVIHNGEAIFPVGYWTGFATVADRLAALQDLGPAGFDVLSYGVGSEPARQDSLIEFVEQLNGYGGRLIYGLFGGDSPITDEISPLQDWVLTSPEGAPIRESPALLGYYHSDDVMDLKSGDLLEKERVVKQADPNHISVHSSGGAISQDSLTAYAESADMPGVQSYPAGIAWAHNVHSGARAIVAAARQFNQAPMMVSHAHSFAEYPEALDPNGRWPTPSELDTYSYLSLAAGVKSLFYFTYGETGRDLVVNPGGLAQHRPALWQQSVEIRSQIRDLERVLLFGQHTTTPEPTFDVYYGRWIYGDKVYVVAVNSLSPGQPLPGGNGAVADDVSGRTNISVPLPESTVGPARPMFSRNSTLTFDEGVLQGELDMLDVQIYELDYAAPVVLNGDFESDFQQWQPEGDAEVVTEGDTRVLRARSTQNSASVSTDITHRVLPGQRYSFSGDLKGEANSGVTAFVQVRDYRNEIIFTEALAANTDAFETQSLTFTAPEEFGSVVVGVWRDKTGTGEAFVDNLRINTSTTTSPPSVDPKQVVIRARGTTGREELALRSGDETLASWPLTTAWQEYSYERETDTPLQVVFTNDAVEPDGKDRNVQIDYLVWGADTLQAEDQPVNTGSWDAELKQCGGGASEWLYCSGCIGFGSEAISSDPEVASARSAVSGSALQVYPNPSQDRATVRLPPSARGATALQVLNMTGQLVRSTWLKDQRQTTLSLGELPPGTYLIKVIGESRSWVERLVIE